MQFKLPRVLVTVACGISGLTAIPAGAWSQQRVVEIDIDEGGSLAGPVVAGTPTSDAVLANKLFASEQFARAALVFDRVYRGETGDDDGNKQIAQFNLAVSLYQLRFHQHAYSIFSEIADKPNHLKFHETLLWLAKLATLLPEPADVIERVGKYSQEHVDRFNNANQRDLFWQLNFLLGKYKYRNRQFDEAISQLERVNERSPWFAQAQILSGLAHVQKRKSQPALRAFQRVVKATTDGGAQSEESIHLRDLAYLSTARLLYSSAFRPDEQGAPSFDSGKLTAAIQHWNRIGTGSEFWTESRMEQSWAYFMLGDYPRVLGGLHTLQAPYFASGFFPEGDLLKAQIYFSMCQFENASAVASASSQEYGAIQKQLKELTSKLEKEEDAFAFFRGIAEKKITPSRSERLIFGRLLRDRHLQRFLVYVRQIEDEGDRLAKAPDFFARSSLATDAKESTELARELVIRTVGESVKEHFQFLLGALDHHQEQLAALRRGLAAPSPQTNAPIEAKNQGAVERDEEHIRWPFDGEFWLDELGSYRQAVVSKCRQ